MGSWQGTVLALSRLPEVGPRLLSAVPAWVWSRDGSRLLWANPAGGARLGAAKFAQLAKRSLVGESSAPPQPLRALASAASEKGTLARLRLGDSVHGVPVACHCRLVRAGSRCAACSSFPPRKLDAQTTVVSLAAFFSDIETSAVVLAADGSMLAGDAPLGSLEKQSSAHRAGGWRPKTPAAFHREAAFIGARGCQPARSHRPPRVARRMAIQRKGARRTHARGQLRRPRQIRRREERTRHGQRCPRHRSTDRSPGDARRRRCAARRSRRPTPSLPAAWRASCRGSPCASSGKRTRPIAFSSCRRASRKWSAAMPRSSASAGMKSRRGCVSIRAGASAARSNSTIRGAA